MSQAEKLIEFLAALIKDAGKKVFLILDNLRVHHSKIVKAWVAERKDQIELFYLPSYTAVTGPECVKTPVVICFRYISWRGDMP